MVLYPVKGTKGLKNSEVACFSSVVSIKEGNTKIECYIAVTSLLVTTKAANGEVPQSKEYTKVGVIWRFLID